MDTTDILLLIHPAIAVVVVFPIMGIVIHQAWLTRQRRLQSSQEGGKSKISPTVGPEHLKLGRYLTGSVVGATLIALAYSVFIKTSPWGNPTQAGFLILMFGFAIASLVFLYKANTKLWRGIFATLSGMALVILGCQEGVYRRGFEWYVSHYYYGIAASLLMIFSLAIIQDIYQDRSHRWRVAHTVLNCVALLLFVGQGFTGSRDLLEIPLSWQKPHVFQCDYANKTCPQPTPPPQQNP